MDSILQRRRAMLATREEEMAKEILGAGWTIWYEKITVGDNDKTTVTSCFNYIKGLLEHTSPKVLMVRRVDDESPSPSQNEFGMVRSPNIVTSVGSSGSFIVKRYTNNKWSSTLFQDNYDGVITSGSVFEVVGIITNW